MASKIFRLFCFICVAFMTSGCSIYRVNSEELSNQYHPSKSATQVEYIETIQQPYEVIGYVTVNTERRQPMSEVIEKMRKEAGIIGGDAITNLTTNASGSWKKVPPQKLMENAYIRANFTASVVAFK